MQGVASTEAERLRTAIQRWGGPKAVAAFSRAMQERGARGATRESIHQVLRRREPSLSFVREAAAVLGVTPDWLAFGTGPATPEEETALAELARWAVEGGRAIDALADARERRDDELAMEGGDHA